MAAEKQIKSDGKWIQIVIGKPWMKGLEAKEKIAKKWGIKYQYKTVGCVMTKEKMESRKQRELVNQEYFKELNQKFGNDWREKFDKEVEKESKR